MTQDNQFQQYGYDHYLKAPQNGAGGGRRPLKAGMDGAFKNALTSKFENPVFATIFLLAVGVAFAGVLLMAYPSGKNPQEEIPIVTADLRPVKVRPSERGGMEVPYRDSTILADVGRSTTRWDKEPGVENLLAPEPEDLTSKEEALARAVADDTPRDVPFAAPPPAVQPEHIDIPDMAAAETEDEPLKSPSPDDILQKIEKDKPVMVASASVKAGDTEVAGEEDDDRPKLHAAATSPETLDFVRSVLDQKDQKQDSPSSEETSSAASVEPAAGAAVAAKSMTSGTYYVQLASISARERAGAEWAKFQKTYAGQLSSADYRVQEADLGARGTFYRIQAGPFSKEDADSICNAIKAQKPGGCLVVK